MKAKAIETQKELKEIPKRKLIIKIDWWLGRNIAMTGAITEKAKQQDVEVIASRPLAFWGNPFIKKIHGLDDRNLFEDVIKWNDYIEIEPYIDPEFFNKWVNRLEIVKRQLWLDKIAEPILYLAEHEKIWNVLEWQKPILFQPFWSTMQANGADKSYRSIRVEDAQYLANELIKKGFTVYVVERNDQPKLQNCVSLDMPDMRRIISLCARYPLLACDSCLHHATKAFWKQSVVVRAWTDFERYWYKSHINLREFPMVEHTPMRLPMNSFDFDISNQYTNKFSREFLDKIINLFQ